MDKLYFKKGRLRAAGNSPGEVSNRLVVGMGMLVVVVVLAVPLGFLLLPRILKKLEGPARVGWTVNENFASSSLDPQLELVDSGKCNWTFSDGMLHMKLGGRDADSGIVVLSNAIDITKPMSIRTRVRCMNIGCKAGWASHVEILYIAQLPVKPVPGDQYLHDHKGRIRVAQYGTNNIPSFTRPGDITVTYQAGFGKGMYWNFKTKKWGSAKAVFNGKQGKFYLSEFFSNGKTWHIILREETGLEIARTAAVKWSEVWDTGKPYWFYIGDKYSKFYWGDMDVDFIHIDYTPTQLKTGVERRK